MKKEGVWAPESVVWAKIIVKNAQKKEIYAKNALKVISKMKTVDAHIQQIVPFLKKENALSVTMIIF